MFSVCDNGTRIFDLFISHSPDRYSVFIVVVTLVLFLQSQCFRYGRRLSLVLAGFTADLEAHQSLPTRRLTGLSHSTDIESSVSPSRNATSKLPSSPMVITAPSKLWL